VRLPFLRDRRRAPRDPTKPTPDERVYGRHYTGPAPWAIGLGVALLIAIGSYLAFTKELPWSDEGYQVRATFDNVATLRETAPVRIAGVTVGEVTAVEAQGDGAEVTFSVSEEGRPIHEDAEIEIRPRLFLEGNFFLDVQPGSPSAPEVEDGGEIPVTQTATAVQLDEVLAALREPERRGLRLLLEGYGTALTYEPTPVDDVDQDPTVQGESAAEAINDSFRFGGDAGRGTAIVNEALLGENPRDLSRLIAAQARIFTQLASRESDLSDLITNFNVTARAFAGESANLSATVEELAPTLEEARTSLASLSGALPSVRALAIEARPGIQELPETIESAGPWLEQTRALLGADELGGLAPLLRASSRGLAQTAAATKPLFDEQAALGRCTSQVLIPTGNVAVEDQFATGESNFHEFFLSTVQLAGESQGFDGNGPYVRFQSGGGDQLLQAANPGGSIGNTKVFGNAITAPEGIQPVLPDELPPFRMDVPCASNRIPSINGPAAAPGDPDLVPVP